MRSRVFNPSSSNATSVGRRSFGTAITSSNSVTGRRWPVPYTSLRSLESGTGISLLGLGPSTTIEEGDGLVTSKTSGGAGTDDGRSSSSFAEGLFGDSFRGAAGADSCDGGSSNGGESCLSGDEAVGSIEASIVAGGRA
jgi:hypothetical protein